MVPGLPLAGLEDQQLSLDDRLRDAGRRRQPVVVTLHGRLRIDCWSSMSVMPPRVRKFRGNHSHAPRISAPITWLTKHLRGALHEIRGIAPDRPGTVDCH